MANISSAHGNIVIDYDILKQGTYAVRSFLKLLSLTDDYTEYATQIDLADSINLLEEALIQEWDLTIEFEGCGRWAYDNNVKKLFKLLKWVSQYYHLEAEYQTVVNHLIKVDESIEFKFVDIEESCNLYYGAIIQVLPCYTENHELTTKTLTMGEEEWQIDTNQHIYFKLS